MEFHRVGNVVLHVRRLGDPDKPLVVFCNSLGSDLRIWEAVMPHLLDRHSVLLHDQRGHGLSDAPPGPYDVPSLAADVVALADLAGATRFGLVGLSVGGMVAQACAAAHPDRVAALVLCDTAARIGDEASWQARIDAVEGGGIGGIADAALERWFTPAYRSGNPDALQGWRNMLTRQPAHGYAATCAALRDADLRGSAASIRAPTLCLVGDADLSTPPDLVRETAAAIPGATFATIAGAAHIPCVEQPEVLARLVASHVERCWAG